MRDNLKDTVQAFNASVGSVERSFLSKARKLVELNAAGDELIRRSIRSTSGFAASKR